MSKNKTSFWVVLSLVGLICLFFLLQWNSFNAPFERDEGNYAYGAWIMTKGLVPYVDTFEMKPPLIFLPYLIALFIKPDALWPIHLIASVSLFFTLVLIGLVAGKSFGRRVGWLAVWFALPMIMFPYLAPYAANTEKFMILPLMGLLAIRVYKKSWFWAGVCGGAAVMYKQIALPVVAFVLLFWLIEDWQTSKDTKTSGRHFVAALTGGFIVSVLSCGYFFLRGGFFNFWESTVYFNRYYAVSAGLTYHHLFTHFRAFLAAWPALFALLIWFVLKRPPGWGFYLSLLFVSLLTVFNTPYSHYYIMLMPVWAIITAASLDSLAGQLAGFLKRLEWQTMIAIVLAGLIITSMLWSVRGWLTLSPEEITARRYGYYNPFIESPIVAKRIAEISSPSDSVFLAGTEQQISYYAKRICPNRFSGMYVIFIPQPKTLAYQQELIKSLEQKPPKIIVWVKSPISWLVQANSPRLALDYLGRLVRDKYYLVGGSLRYGDKVYWAEPLKNNQLGYCSIMVYKKK